MSGFKSLHSDHKGTVAMIQFASRIAIDTLNDLAVNAYEKQLISYEKLAYLLSISELTPADIGVYEPKKSLFPSDDELSEIMEG